MMNPDITFTIKSWDYIQTFRLVPWDNVVISSLTHIHQNIFKCYLVLLYQVKVYKNRIEQAKRPILHVNKYLHIKQTFYLVDGLYVYVRMEDRWN